MPLVFSVTPGEDFNTENVIFVGMCVLDKQNITIDKVPSVKLEFHDIESGKPGEMEIGIVGIHGMNHQERMHGLEELVRSLFADREEEDERHRRNQLSEEEGTPPGTDTGS